MTEGNEIAGAIVIVIGLLLIRFAVPMGEFFGFFREDRHSAIFYRVEGVIFIALGLYFIFG